MAVYKVTQPSAADNWWSYLCLNLNTAEVGGREDSSTKGEPVCLVTQKSHQSSRSGRSPLRTAARHKTEIPDLASVLGTACSWQRGDPSRVISPHSSRGKHRVSNSCNLKSQFSWLFPCPSLTDGVYARYDSPGPTELI